MPDKNYAAYHVHTDLSLLDSATKFEQYVDRAVELGQRAIGFTEHGNIYQWVAKKMYCDEKGVKYLHGVECYLTETHDLKERDNYHTILIAKNYAGVLELNKLVSIAATQSHRYHKPRLSFNEFLGTSNNIIKISACLASPLNKLPITHKRYRELARHYDYFEIQPHDFPEQKQYNLHLAQLSKELGKPLIAGTDTHSLDKYKAECRSILLAAKSIEYSDEDAFDLTYKTYDELVEMFARQDALPQHIYIEAIENTNRMADSVEGFELDLSFKYPKLYGARDGEIFRKRIGDGLKAKIESGAITTEQISGFEESIPEECRVFDKIEMTGFMLFMSELATWCKTNGIPIGFNRGSVGGSRVAYVTDIIDLNPEQWHTVFSRFCNEDRKEIGDIDIDLATSDRDRVYDYIINRFGQKYTAFILAVGTIKSKGCIDEIIRALGFQWDKANLADTKSLKAQIAELKNTGESRTVVAALTKTLSSIKEKNEKIHLSNPWIGDVGTRIKQEFDTNPDAARAKYPEVFYYYDGLIDTAISQSMHPAGIVASPLTLSDHYGTFEDKDGRILLQIDMDCIHEVGLVKYDILGLKNVQIIKDAYDLIGKPYPKSHEINWDDEAVWKDMLRSPVGVFQFESDYSHSLLRQYQPKSIFDMSLVTAALRPSGASYRDKLMQHIPNKNPSPLIDELLKDSCGFLCYQEDSLKFLQKICGLSGSEADNIRRAIGRKDKERLEKALPQILEGYCEKSPQPRHIAEEEAKAFLQIIEDSADYQFGYNHSIGYCMIGYLCAYLRYYHPYEFITAYLNNANSEDDVKNGSALAEMYGIQIVPPRFGLSKDKYIFNREQKVIAKGIESIKYMNSSVANELYDLARGHRPESFMELLMQMNAHTSLNTRQRDILIKIDYFADYGNIPELSRMVDFFTFLKNGEAKRISKDKLNGTMLKIIGKFASDKNKDGSTSKTFAIVDMEGLLKTVEFAVKSLNLPDTDLKEKIQTQLELMGYVGITTQNQDDKRKLLITEVYPLCNKTSGEVWGYAAYTRSIGTGKMARLTIRSALYNRNPVRQFDIIYAKEVAKNKGGYWYLLDYEQIA